MLTQSRHKPLSVASARSVILLVVLSLISLAAVSAAARLASPQESYVHVSLTGAVERDGKLVSTEGLRVGPNEVITWQIEAVNRGQKIARAVRTVAPVPAGTEFVAGSAVGQGVSQILYSIDGGRNYSERPVVKVVKNGVEREVPASPTVYTNVQFVWDGELPPRAARQASYRTRVR